MHWMVDQGEAGRTEKRGSSRSAAAGSSSESRRSRFARRAAFFCASRCFLVMAASPAFPAPLPAVFRLGVSTDNHKF